MMKRWISGLICFMVMIFSVNVCSALIDAEKHHQWRLEKMQELLDSLKASEKAEYIIPFMKDYDKNADGFIDKKESEAVKEYVQQNLAVKKPA